MIHFSFYFQQRKLDSRECGVVFCKSTGLTFSYLADSSILSLNVYCPISVQNQSHSTQSNRVHGSWYVMFYCMLVLFDFTHIPLVYFTGTGAIKRCHCSISYHYILRDTLTPGKSIIRFHVCQWSNPEKIMMTSSNGNILRVSGPLCGEFTGPGEFFT